MPRIRISYVVESILKHNEKARGSDPELFIGVLEAQGANLSERQKDILRDVNLESCRRMRQKFQEAGRYLPSKEIQDERRFRSMQVRQSIKSTKPEKVPSLVEQVFPGAKLENVKLAL